MTGPRQTAQSAPGAPGELELELEDPRADLGYRPAPEQRRRPPARPPRVRLDEWRAATSGFKR